MAPIPKKIPALIRESPKRWLNQSKCKLPLAGMSLVVSAPLRRTLALGEDSDLSDSSDFSALTCCTVPKIAFKISTAMITSVLYKSPVKAEITAAMIKMMTIKSLNCSKKTWKAVFFLPSTKAFLPYLAKFSSACLVDKPSLPVLNSFKTSSLVCK